MQERLVEILIYVLNEVRKSNKPIDEIDLSLLEQKGYTKSEIGIVFSWLFDRLHGKVGIPQQPTRQGTKSFRVLNSIEKLSLSPAAYGYLIELYELNIIGAGEFESIIEYALLNGFENVDIKTLQYLLASVLFNPMSQDNISERIIINPNDTVN